MTELSGNESYQHLKESIQTVTSLPGVYRMNDRAGNALYIGKAKNLRKRLQSYFRKRHDSAKTSTMMRLVNSLQTSVTHSESEALLLEQNLIKQHRPRFNILLRDDKSYPYLFLSNHQEYPYLSFRRSNKAGKGTLFGPYSNSHSVRSVLALLQKLFLLRSCSDVFFRNRSRPCLQYQIGKCSAPCVGYISPQEYQKDVRMAILSIKGKNNQVIEQLTDNMNHHAAQQNYEQAAQMRDKITTLRKIQEHQAVSQHDGDADIIAIALHDYGCAVQHMLVRTGKVVGTFTHFPRIRLQVDEQSVLEQYIVQKYLLTDAITDIPANLIVSTPLANAGELEKLFYQTYKSRIAIVHNVRGERASWLKLAQTNAQQGLKMSVSSSRSHYGRIQKLADELGLHEAPKLIECYDISHTFGEATYGSCVVFTRSGAQKSRYRLFAIRETDKGDDYTAIREVVRRRFRTLDTDKIPDLICIDGGLGQLTAALTELEQRNLSAIPVLGIAKGKERKPGNETLFFTRVGADNKPAQIVLPGNSPALHIIQLIRDEAHRFAITSHRKKRGKAKKRSLLEDIPGIGSAKRKQLIMYFGGLQAVTHASVADLQKVSGVSQQLAKIIYQHLHEQ